MNNQLKILICDDNIAVHESISLYLKNEDMLYVSAYNGQEALDKFQTEDFDAIILDIMMPIISGIDLCKIIRKTSDVPILILSSKSEEIDRIIGLELGADDYVTKPFSPREVVVRIRTILRRKNIATPNTIIPTTISLKGLVIDTVGYSVSVNKKQIALTPKETALLIYFAKNQNQVLSRDQLLSHVWGYDYYGDTRAVDTLVKRLRPKISNAENGLDIKSIYGIGYKFEVTE